MSGPSDGRLFWWRHGETEWNLVGKTQGSADIPLNDRGREQARAAATELAKVVRTPFTIVASPLVRAAATAEALAELTGVTVQLDPRLEERSYGAWEGTIREERVAHYPDAAAEWDAGLEPSIEGYERNAPLAARMLAAVAEHTAAGGDVVLVSHSSAIRIAMLALLGKPLVSSAASPIPSLPNAGWERWERTDGAWR